MMDKQTARLVLAADSLITNLIDSGEHKLDPESLCEENEDIQETCTDEDGDIWHPDVWELRQALSAFDTQEAQNLESTSLEPTPMKSFIVDYDGTTKVATLEPTSMKSFIASHYDERDLCQRLLPVSDNEDIRYSVPADVSEQQLVDLIKKTHMERDKNFNWNAAEYSWVNKETFFVRWQSDLGHQATTTLFFM